MRKLTKPSQTIEFMGILCYTQTMNMMNELLEAKTEINTLNRKVEELNILVQHYEELFRLSQRRLFGQSSEKTVIAGQMNLWNADETELLPIEPEFEETLVKRKKRKGKREKTCRNYQERL